MEAIYTFINPRANNSKRYFLYVLFFVLAQFGIIVITNAQVSGTVYRDFNANGAKNNTASYNEPGAAGITIKAYDNAGTLLGTTTSGINGAFSFSAGIIPAATKVRLEFSGWQSADFTAPFGANNKTSVQFVTAPSTTADFGINYPGDYIDNLNARIILPTYANGNSQVDNNNWFAAKNGDGSYAFNYDGIAAANVIADMGQIGSVWATAYSRKADKVFYAAFVKRHVSMGPLGMNGIYVTNNAKSTTNKSNTTSFVNLNAVNPAFDAGDIPGRSFSPGDFNKTQPNNDPLAFTEVGKKGIGGMAISDDGRYLYLINLNDRKLWRVDIGINGTAPTLATQIVSYNAFPVTEGNSSFRPFAVKFYRGAIYVGGVLDGVKPDNSSVDRAELKMVVLKVDATVTPGAETFTTVLDAPLTYNRKANMNTGFSVNHNTNYVDPNGTIPAATTSHGSWHPWARTFAEITVVGNNGTAIYPQPMLSSIEFNPADGSMILGLMDRTGHQTGNQNRGTTGTSLFTGNAAGDILKASNNGTYTSFTLENNGSDGTNTSAGAGNGEGPGGGEFYFTDRFSAGLGGALGIGNTSSGKLYIDHEETSTGSILNFPGKELISTAFDPITTWYTGGVRYYNNSNGVALNGKVLYEGNDVSVFGKANGLGDLEIITAPAPIEIGNRVWFDADGDGIQDAEEIGIAGVTVSLVQGNTVIATATTDADGNYIFSSDPNGVNTASAVYNIAQIQPGAALIIRIVNATGTSVQTPLSTYELTVINNGGLDVDADLRDSDAVLTGNDAEISITTGVAGENNHTYDFGFVTIGGVGGGGGGGVESKSLGDAIAYRVFNRAVKSEQGPVDYSKLPIPDQYNRYAGASVGTALKLQDILPTKLSNGYKSFVSTPNDIISITNAKEILSIDFVSNNVSKAVAFGTRTVGQVYDHTKAICDRLKGFELISLKKINVKGYELVQYNLKNNNGEIEYATSFIIGAESGRNNYTIQSNWLNKDYTLEEMMYNIQLWGGSPSLVIEMATDIITRLNTGLPVVAIPNTAGLPGAYFTAGKRSDENVTLTLQNNLSATTGYFEISDRANEQSTSLVKRTIPFTAKANGLTSISIPTNDLFESTINLYINGKLEDQVFMADGAWGVDYNTNTTSLKKFVVTNSNTPKVKDEFSVFRNAEIAGTTPDYITVYKLLRAGGTPQDLSSYKSLKFTATGNAPVVITLVKQSIKNWDDQYNFQLPISNETKEYAIGLEDFKSTAFSSTIDLKDISSIIITIVPPIKGKSTDLQLSLSNISFSKEDMNYINSLKEVSMSAFPNPVTGNKFNVRFKSDNTKTLQLKISDGVTGKVILTKQVNAIRGENVVPVEMENNGAQKVLIINLDGTGVDNTKYKATKILAGKY